MTFAFGPVPSRRLGRSLGINNIPPKTCTYACIYCQVGRTSDMRIQRKEFYDPDVLVRSVSAKVKDLTKKGEIIDYITFVPDGEPTLDIHLGKEIEMLRALEIPIAIITNASLLWKSDVQEEVKKADWISVKVDTVDDDLWHRINRPHRKLKLQEILHGIRTVRKEFQGQLVTETMLVKGLNEQENALSHTADFLSEIKPDKCYISIPIRPPAEENVSIPDEESLLHAFDIFHGKLEKVELLSGAEKDEFTTGEDPENDLLNITAVHPMREEAVRLFLKRSNKDWSLIEKLLIKNKLVRIEYNNDIFYLRKIS
ncbi:MAG: radical SAM protein [Calditrichaeota bacterium]|nr:radical SAM protein [Calditrichota bacterium]RQW03165.1 MAG: radical SAM protein [Calditrichota bacterium]